MCVSEGRGGHGSLFWFEAVKVREVGGLCLAERICLHAGMEGWARGRGGGRGAVTQKG